MSKLRKMTALGLSAVLAISLLAGCKGNTAAGSKPDTSAVPSSGNKLPLVDKPTKVSIWMINPQTKLMNNFGDMLVWPEIEKRTGVDIEFIHPTGDGTEAFNLMIASNDLPDVIYNNWGSTLSKYLDDKVIVKLDDLINKYAPDVKRRVLAVPEVKQQLVLDDGSIGMFPQVDLDLSRNIYRGFLIRKDWLNKLNLKVPTTIDEWYTTLKTFKDKDPNGNGKADEIPLSDEKGGGLKQFSGAWGLRDSFAPDPKTGKIIFGPMEPGYKDYLATMAKWYKEGLIDSEYGTVDRKVIDSKVMGNLTGALWGTNGSYQQNYITLMQPKDPNFDMVGVPYPIGQAGKSYTTWDQTTRYIAGYGGAITSKCKDPVLVTKLLNYLYSDEGDTLQNWGIEGKSYTVVNGEKKFTDEIMKPADNKTPLEALMKYTNISNGFMRIYDMKANNAVAVSNPKQTKDSVETWAKADMSILMPIVTPTPAENQQLTTIMSEINTYYNTMLNKFIMGREPIENFDQYVNTLKKMGIQDAIKIEQAAYDRFKARK